MKLVCCQSCGMPMQVENDFGLEIDGRLNKKYCTYCYQAGQFTAFVSMEQMIQITSELWHDAGFTCKEEAIKHMQTLFPQLSRWNKKQISSEI